jgi:hypothetical protein
VAGVWELAWNRLAALLPPAASPKPPARQEKEGGVINPDGHAGFTPPVPSASPSADDGK